MDEPSYKTYQYLHDYSLKLIQTLKRKQIKIKISDLLLDFNYLIQCESNIRSNRMNFPIDFINFEEHLNCFLYECAKYKFSREIRKIIHRLEQYQKHLQKM
jgi:hypothetical protein